jgi:hypothetical protein
MIFLNVRVPVFHLKKKSVFLVLKTTTTTLVCREGVGFFVVVLGFELRASNFHHLNNVLKPSN